MIAALASGVLLGLSAGLAPGPLLALVLAQTYRHGPREGCKIALSPLVTDGPIILVAWALATRLAELHLWLGLVSIAGAGFVLYLAWENLRAIPLASPALSACPRSWLKGIVTNLLSPHPWLFWLSIGAATLAKARSESTLAAGMFLFGFYLLLVGAKVGVALLAGRTRNLVTGRPYRLVMRGLALLLGLFAVLLLREGLEHLAACRLP